MNHLDKQKHRIYFYYSLRFLRRLWSNNNTCFQFEEIGKRESTSHLQVRLVVNGFSDSLMVLTCSTHKSISEAD